MHRLFVTEGIVLAKRGAAEANSIVAIVTPMLGLVRASARSARAERSKLRYGLEPLTLGRFSFVQGKREWKLTGAERVSHELLPQGMAARSAAGRVARLVLRLIPGQEPVPRLFEVLRTGLVALAQAKEAREAAGIEYLLVLKILSVLGYVPHTQELAAFAGEDFSLDAALRAHAARAQLARAINEALKASGL